ncbi:hypothetical protein JCM10914A_02330 [Paenibacillus sp. JCM 10914]|uniref:GNAT family N-acetyltransferase n=1 Tax=Paenibacillus sp. JCM 10914 TaxID=1236974 RepID=UPI0003CC2E32|nr:GNAT family N-acetyltransferase [Paenibacillus sp. JCM 10914]GAE06836.1 hypothetical protein JCM10914_3021 [Paenibacillus sp. JCM 10914]
MVTIEQVEYERKATLSHLLELYQYDFSEFEPMDVHESGRYEYRFLDHYWTEASRYPFFIRVAGKLAGFALVREIGAQDEIPIYSMAEFFVMRKYRNHGVGQQAAFALFSRFQGIWKVGQIEANLPAQTFWKKAIGRYTDQTFEEIREADWDGPIQVFTSVATT